MAPKKTMTLEQRIEADVRDINARAKETRFLSTGVPNVDGTYEDEQIETTMSTLSEIANRVVEKNPSLSLMLIACSPTSGQTHCKVFVHVALDVLSASEWLACTDSNDTGVIFCEYPIKEKDVIINKSCNYLRKASYHNRYEAFRFDDDR